MRNISFIGSISRIVGVALASVCFSITPSKAADILTIQLEAVFGPLGMPFEGDAPGSVDIEPGDIMSFYAVLTDLENTGVPSFRFAPTLLQATANINGAEFAFGNVRARTNTSSDLDFNILGDTEFTDASDFELTGSGPLLESGYFTELTFRNDNMDFTDISSLAELIPYLRTDIVSLSIFEMIEVTGPNALRLSGGTEFSAEVTSLEFTLTDAQPVPLPAAFPLMAGGLALFGASTIKRRRHSRHG